MSIFDIYNGVLMLDTVRKVLDDKGIAYETVMPLALQFLVRSKQNEAYGIVIVESKPGLGVAAQCHLFDADANGRVVPLSILQHKQADAMRRYMLEQNYDTILGYWACDVDGIPVFSIKLIGNEAADEERLHRAIDLIKKTIDTQAVVLMRLYKGEVC